MSGGTPPPPLPKDPTAAVRQREQRDLERQMKEKDPESSQQITSIFKTLKSIFKLQIKSIHDKV